MSDEQTLGLSYYEQRKGAERSYQLYLDSIQPMYYPMSGYCSKTSDTTRYSATTMSADSQLRFYASGGGYYHIDAWLIFSGVGSPSGNGISVIVSGTNPSSQFLGQYTVLSGNTFYSSGASTFFNFSSTTRVNYVRIQGLLINGSTPNGTRTGSVELQWGWLGGVANSASTQTLIRSSWMMYYMT
jgi:hypothetical protein